MINSNIKKLEVQNNFSIDFAITEQCNLACKYCYVKNRNEYMNNNSFDHFYSITLPQLKKLYGFSNYQFHFFGGEPLLNFKLIKYIVPILKNDKNCKECGIITNGLLITPEIVDFIHEYDIKTSISFDGLGNKINRVDINNESTYEKYKNNKALKNIMKGSHITIDPNTAPIIDEILIDLVENWNMVSIDFALVRDDVWTDLDIINFEKANDRMTDKWIEYIEKGINLNSGWLTVFLKDALQYKKNNYKRTYCCFAGFNGVSIMPSGDAYPCTRFGSAREYPIIENNVINKNNFEFFNRDELDQTKNETCLKCYLYNYCNSGCKYIQIKNNFQPLESICKLNKIIFKSALKVHKKLKNNSLWLKSLKI